MTGGAGDPYSLLGVAADSPATVLKSAYRRAARKCHPDKHPGDPSAKERFNRLREAYEVLSDPGRRREIDEKRRTEVWRNERVANQNSEKRRFKEELEARERAAKVARDRARGGPTRTMEAERNNASGSYGGWKVDDPLKKRKRERKAKEDRQKPPPQEDLDEESVPQVNVQSAAHGGTAPRSDEAQVPPGLSFEEFEAQTLQKLLEAAAVQKRQKGRV